MVDMDNIRVVLVDDHAVVRSGLEAVMMSSDDVTLVGEAGNGKEAIGLCEKLQPDAVLMDLVMPEMDGITATQIIHERYPEICIIVLTSFKERELVEGALKAGAMSYLLKNISADELLQAIRGTVTGHSRLSQEAVESLIQRIKQSPEPNYDLTEREQEILTLMVEGLSNSNIAKRTYISISTVKFHVSSILSKLSATSRTEAVAIAIKNQLVN